MKPHKKPIWKRVLGKMALNLGAVYGKFYGSGNGAAIYDLSKPGGSRKRKARPRLSRKRS
jgi:hypothetical protein